MMAMPNLACYQCITANNNNIAPCIGPPACVAATFTPEIMGGGMPGIIDTICTGLCQDTCSDNDNMVIAEKQALMGGGCDARGTPVASTCPPPPPPPPPPGTFACSWADAALYVSFRQVLTRPDSLAA
jgi:hypothetical protein